MITRYKKNIKKKLKKNLWDLYAFCKITLFFDLFLVIFPNELL